MVESPPREPSPRTLTLRPRRGAATAARSAAALTDLWHFYDEHATQARQHESLRATVTGTLAAIAAAVTALAGVGGLSLADVPAGAAVLLIGGLGVGLSLKHFERNRFHTEVMRQVLLEIQRVRGSASASPRLMTDLREAAKKEHIKGFRTWRRKEKPAGSPWIRARLYVLWAGLALGVAAVGALIIALAVIGVTVPQ